MTDRAHLDECLSSASTPLARKLIETFRIVIRDPGVSSVEYAQRLRLVMEEHFKEQSTREAEDPQNS